MLKIEELDKIKKIDTHSHIGIDVYNPVISNPNDYQKNAEQKNIVRALLIGVPNPIYRTSRGEFIPLNYRVNGGKIEIFSELRKDNGTISFGSVAQNPFAESNRQLEKGVSKLSSETLKLHFIPHVHPLLDTKKYLEEMLEKQPLALKIKGSTWGFKPTDIPSYFFKLVKQYDVPLLVHTDYSANPTNVLFKLFGEQDPLNWLDVLEKYEVRASLAHGLRLCQKSWNRVNRAGEQFIVGFGPRLNTNGYRVKKTGGDYVTNLLEMADIDRLTYDIDYAWNKKYNDKLDWNLDHEIIGKIPENKLIAFYRGNAEKFYRINSE